MARPPTWFPRIQKIQAFVATSVRSHYDRNDLQTLFELRPRAAGALLEMLPTTRIGTSLLVSREALASFLSDLAEAHDPAELMAGMRMRKGEVSRRKLRALVRADLPAVDLGSLPEAISLARGRLEVSFSTLESLAEALLTLARLLEEEGDEMARLFEPEPPPAEDAAADREGVRQMFAELEADEVRLRI